VSNLIIICSVVRSDAMLKELSEVQRKQRGMDRQTRSLIAMLVSVSVAFILLKTPFHIVRFAFPTQGLSFATTTADFVAMHCLAIALSLCLQFLNHAINFYLYVLTGKEFRSEFIKLMRRMFCRENLMTEQASMTPKKTSSSMMSMEKKNERTIYVKY
jgi:23S rRNA U2552 (ribose-2'-O)-methylase RlmE/FtsJ